MHRTGKLQLIAAASASILALPLSAVLPTLPAAAQPTTSAAARAAAAGPVVRSEVWVENGRVLDVAISSPSLEGGDWAVKWVRLFVPPGWSKDASRTWPTLWLLHGGLDDHKSWAEKSTIKQLTAGRNVIVVMPETSWCSAYSDWWNQGNGGPPKWETYLLRELDPILRNSYRANTTRAVGGNSMGGIGSFGLPARNPGFFKAAASYSGNLDPLHAKVPGSPDLPGLGCASDWKRVWGDYNIPAQRTIWEAHDPVLQAGKLRGLTLYLAAGNKSGDSAESTVYPQAQAMAHELNAAGIPYSSDIPANGSGCDGGHNWACWSKGLDRSLPLLLPAIGVPYP